jgi:hypothetical protein
MRHTACILVEDKRNTHKSFVETPYEKRLFERDVDERITLKWILEKLVV